MKLFQNIGQLDRILRIGISSVLIYISLIDTEFVADPLSSGILAFFGIVNLLVALIRICPLYTLVGINTCKLA
ncbi:MAG: DUF2892 domain-containing protein [Gammaproteobacteria bacterium]|nr:MAG: DUF2892 domain-containing protein [Gammaproteobacteria bacterium]